MTFRTACHICHAWAFFRCAICKRYTCYTVHGRRRRIGGMIQIVCEQCDRKEQPQKGERPLGRTERPEQQSLWGN